MQCKAVSVATVMKVSCPHCGETHSDPFEVLNTSEKFLVHCDACHEPFHLMVFECGRCDGETALTWTEEDTPEQVEHPRCAHCGHRPDGS